MNEWMDAYSNPDFDGNYLNRAFSFSSDVELDLSFMNAMVCNTL